MLVIESKSECNQVWTGEPGMAIAPTISAAKATATMIQVPWVTLSEAARVASSRVRKAMLVRTTWSRTLWMTVTDASFNEESSLEDCRGIWQGNPASATGSARLGAEKFYPPCNGPVTTN